jgi:hypothetical protein
MPSSNFDDIFSSLETLNTIKQKSDFIESKLSELKQSEKMIFKDLRRLSRLQILNERLRLHESLHLEKALLIKLHGLKNVN